MQHLFFFVALFVVNVFFLALGYFLGFLYHYLNGYVVGFLSGGLFFAWTIILAYIWHYTYQPTLGQICVNIWTFAAVLLLGYFIPVRVSLAAYYQIAANNHEVRTITAQNISETDESEHYFFFHAANIRPNLNGLEGTVMRLNHRINNYTYLVPLQDERNQTVAWLPIFYQTSTPSNEKENQAVLVAIDQKAKKLTANISGDQFFVNVENSNNSEVLIGGYSTFRQMREVAQRIWQPKSGEFPADIKRFVVPIDSPEAYRANLMDIIWLWSFGLINAIIIAIWLLETMIKSYRGLYS